jgi:hypothetical protein
MPTTLGCVTGLRHTPTTASVHHAMTKRTPKATHGTVALRLPLFCIFLSDIVKQATECAPLRDW